MEQIIYGCLCDVGFKDGGGFGSVQAVAKRGVAGFWVELSIFGAFDCV